MLSVLGVVVIVAAVALLSIYTDDELSPMVVALLLTSLGTLMANGFPKDALARRTGYTALALGAVVAVCETIAVFTG
ncbi:hypothetical protein [Euzebya tangerina]|uniref:hypothetical protein n=1 Tax=Euzebya tangerina TaxID=591198 RepID=UPI0013C3782C|nr:hypothetical protein [Euzebya tangerina]